MKFRIVVEKEAEIDLNEATDYYYQISPKLATAFVERFEELYHYISFYPNQKKVFEQVASINFNHFPYRIFLLVDEPNMQVKILRILHTSSSPSRWPGV